VIEISGPAVRSEIILATNAVLGQLGVEHTTRRKTMRLKQIALTGFCFVVIASFAMAQERSRKTRWTCKR